MTSRGRFVCWFIAAWIASASSVLAADGVLEINQACATNGGCFPGDTTGFPVTITSPGSYRLTSSLDLSALAPQTAIQISAPAVNLDLGGFEIIGPTTCSGSGPTISCEPTGTGQGVEFFTASLASSVRNGTIRGFGDSGVAANPEGIRISDITAIHNGNDGFAAVRSALIENCVAIENGGDGFDGDAASVFRGLIAIGNGIHGIEIDQPGGSVTASSSRGNGNRGYNMGHSSKFGPGNASTNNVAPDNCGGGICTDKRRFYVTASPVPANQATGACASGFSMASMSEISDSSNLVYDGRLGFESLDGGTGVPWGIAGWIHDGVGPDSDSNCSGWTSVNGLNHGGAIQLTAPTEWNKTFTSGSPLNLIAPWITVDGGMAECDSDYRVWCIETP